MAFNVGLGCYHENGNRRIVNCAKKISFFSVGHLGSAVESPLTRGQRRPTVIIDAWGRSLGMTYPRSIDK